MLRMDVFKQSESVNILSMIILQEKQLIISNCAALSVTEKVVHSPNIPAEYILCALSDMKKNILNNIEDGKYYPNKDKYEWITKNIF